MKTKVPTKFIVTVGKWDVPDILFSSHTQEVSTRKAARSLGRNLIENEGLDFYEILEVEEDGALREIINVDSMVHG